MPVTTRMATHTYLGGMTAHQRGVHPKTVPPCHQGLQLLLQKGSEKGPSSGLSVLRTNCYSSSGGMWPGAAGSLEGAMLSRDVRFFSWFFGGTLILNKNGHFHKNIDVQVKWKRLMERIGSIKKPNRKRMTTRKRPQDGQVPRLQSAIPFLP